MALKPCKECGKEVSTKAKTCTNCGAPAPRETSRVAIVLGGIIFIAIVGNMIAPDAPAERSASTIEPTAEPPKPKLTKAEREALTAKAVSGMELERDKIEKISFYSVPGANLYRDNLTAYVSLPDGGRPILRIVFAYHGDDWIFFDQAKVMANDSVVYSRAFPTTSRDNNTAGVFESVDFAAEPADIIALRLIANAKDATIRLSGREDRRDFEISTAERGRLDRALSTWAELNKIAN